MKQQVLPSWYFDSAAAAARGDAANRMYQALGEGNKPAYLAALSDWQQASGGLKGCPGALANCPWNPADTDPNATVISFNGQGQMLMGGQLLPFGK